LLDQNSFQNLKLYPPLSFTVPCFGIQNLSKYQDLGVEPSTKVGGDV